MILFSHLKCSTAIYVGNRSPLCNCTRIRVLYDPLDAKMTLDLMAEMPVITAEEVPYWTQLYRAQILKWHTGRENHTP